MGIEKYSDIISRSRPVSKHEKMSMNDRAAQFAPFAALKGFDEEIEKSSLKGETPQKAVSKAADDE